MPHHELAYTIITNSVRVNITARLMQFVIHPVAAFCNHKNKTNDEYIQELIDFGYTFSSTYVQIYSEKKHIEEERILETNA